MTNWASKLNRCNWKSERSSIEKYGKILTGIKLDPGPSHCHFLKQVHKTSVVEANDDSTGVESNSRIKADGIFTTTPGIKIAVRTADCLGVLLWADGSLVMGLHAGWRSLTGGIINEGLNIFESHNIPANKISALLHPCISLKNFEVGPEVIEGFRGEKMGLSAEQTNLCISKGKRDRWHADLTVGASLNLLNRNLEPENITAIQQCTFDQENSWPSFRRDGRVIKHIWSWIQIDG